MTDAPQAQRPKAEHRRYEAGEVIFREGDPSLSAFIIQSGEVMITRKERCVVILGVDGLFGEGAFLMAGPRDNTAVALVETTVLVVPKKIFDAKIEQADSFIRKLVGILLRTTQNVVGLGEEASACLPESEDL